MYFHKNPPADGTLLLQLSVIALGAISSSNPACLADSHVLINSPVSLLYWAIGLATADLCVL